jgi:hypothetical protein
MAQLLIDAGADRERVLIQQPGSETPREKRLRRHGRQAAAEEASAGEDEDEAEHEPIEWDA